MPAAGARILAVDNARWFCKATAGGAQSIPTGAFTALQLNTEEVDNLGIHDTVTNNSRFVVGLAIGWWMGVATWANGASGTGGRRMRWVMNGLTGQNGGYVSLASATVSAGFSSMQSTCFFQSTAAADYIEAHVFQDTGVAMNTTVSGDLRSSVSLTYLGA